ncbi:MAG: uridine kinase [Chloroflexi bacterium]|nr:MAG: uridine kinase [Chloroflexota bacterium]MBL1195876.1 uridine kinase [Chloroflexota bacterium]NOH13168.1 uridine kinase [Chloroflexota bacterium]
MNFSIQRVLDFIIDRVTPNGTVLVGVDGGAGSGKSTFAHWVAEQISNSSTRVNVVHTDNFFLPSDERVTQLHPLAIVEDIDWKRLRDQVIVPLRSSKEAKFQLFDWPEDSLKDWKSIQLGGVTIIDGIASTRSELSDFYDLRVWFSCPREVRNSRLLRRGDTSNAAIENWMPSEDEYIATHAPDKKAHLIIDSAMEMTATGDMKWKEVKLSLSDMPSEK